MCIINQGFRRHVSRLEREREREREKERALHLHFPSEYNRRVEPSLNKSSMPLSLMFFSLACSEGRKYPYDPSVNLSPRAISSPFFSAIISYSSSSHPPPRKTAPYAHHSQPLLHESQSNISHLPTHPHAIFSCVIPSSTPQHLARASSTSTTSDQRTITTGNADIAKRTVVIYERTGKLRKSAVTD